MTSAKIEKSLFGEACTGYNRVACWARCNLQLTRLRGSVDGVPHELSTGDSFYLASNVPHGVETLLPTRVLDTFSPPRNDYLAIDEKVRHGAL